MRKGVDLILRTQIKRGDRRPGARSTTSTRSRKQDRRALQSPGAEPLWARFYALDTGKPVFLDRDSVTRGSFNDLSRERRNGHAYYGTWPRALLHTDYPSRNARVGR